MNWRKCFIQFLLHSSGQKTWRYYQQALNFSKLSSEEIQALQKNKLKTLLDHCRQNVAYYRDILDSQNDIQSLPIMTKEIIRNEKERLYSNDKGQRSWYKNTSGGSTGEPVVILQDKRYEQWNTANKLFYNHILGKKPGEPEIKFWGSDRDIIHGTLGTKENIINYLYNRRFFNTYNLTKERLSELVSLNNKYMPKSYWAYMEGALELAKYLIETGVEYHSPEFVVSTIAPLTEHNREIIERGMRCPVYNQYGSREVGAIACECKAKMAVHSFPWTHYIEVVDENNMQVPAGVPGRILITTLENYTMPLIRYDIGDIGTESKDCNCGIPGFAFSEISGRTLGYFKLANGDLKHSHFLVQALFYYDWIKKFQIVQESFDKIQIYVIKKDELLPPEKDIVKITKLITEFMDNNCIIEFKYVNEISASSSGKHLYTICHC